MLDCELYGTRASGHHLTNVLLHAVNGALLFLVLRRMTSATGPSAFVAALFVIHPLRVESVAWVAERKDVLSGFFWILTMGFYARYAERPSSVARYLLVALSLTLGLMAKPMLVSIPFVLLLLDVWPLRRYSPFAPRHNGAPPNRGPVSPYKTASASRLLIEKAPLFALAGVSCVITYLVQSRSGSVRLLEDIPFTSRLGNAAVSYIAYIGKTLSPAHLAVFYPYLEGGPSFGEIAVAVLALLGASVASVLSVRKRPYVLVGWFWYLGTLVPVIGLVQVGEQAMADRYTYVTTIGLYVIAAWGASELAARRSGWRAALAIAEGAAVVGLMGMAWVQTRYWQNSVTLFTRALSVTSRNYLAHINLAVALSKAGDFGHAIEHLTEALRIRPTSADAHSNLGAVLGEQGKYEEALHHFDEALRIAPDNAKTLYNLACALDEMGKQDEAARYYEMTLRIEPEHVEANNNLGAILLAKGDPDRAIHYFTEAVRYRPGYAEARCNLATALRQEGKTEEAAKHYREALSLAQAARNTALLDKIQQAMEQPVQPPRRETH